MTPKTTYALWIDTEAKRSTFLNVLTKADLPFMATLKRDKRTDKQNRRQWAILGTIAENTLHHGRKLTPDQWKLVFMAQLFKEVDIVPNLDGDGYVALSRSSSNLTTSEHSDLTTLMEMYCAMHEIDIREHKGE